MLTCSYQITQSQTVKGSIQVVLKCDYPTAKGEANLSLDVRMVQNLDVSVLGITNSFTGN